MFGGKNGFRSGKNQQKMSLRSGKNSKQEKKHLAAAEKHLGSRKNAFFWRQWEKSSEAGKNLSKARKNRPRQEKLQNGTNTFPQREKRAALLCANSHETVSKR